MQTVVCFRTAEDGTVTAVFPFERDRQYYGCYAHVGQHGSCSREWALGDNRPATRDEYADLKRELEAAPFEYQLDVRQTWPRGA